MNLKNRLPLLAVIFTSVLCIAISVFSLKSGQFIIFQNVFYIPIIVACFYYGKRGFAVSVALSCSYFFLIITFTNDPVIIRDALIRVSLFIIIAAVITTLSMARAQAEASLEKEREKFRTVADYTYDWEYWTDPQQNMLYVSPSCERISGYRPEDFMTDSGLIHDVVHPDDLDIFKCHADHYHDIQIDSVGELVFRILSRKGETIWISHLCQPVHNSNGQFLGRRASNRNITERKHTEEALRESETKYQLLFDNSLDAIAVLGNSPPKFLFVNPAFISLFGYTEEEILAFSADNMFLLVHTEDREIVRNRLHSRFRQETTPNNYEFRIVTRDGLVRWVEVSATIFFNRGQIFSQAIYRDITDRKLTEETLRETKNYLENLIDYANAPIIVWNPQFRIIRFNHAFEFLTGRTAADVMGKHLEILFPPDLVDSSMERIRKTLLGEHWESVEISILNIGGTVHTVLWNSATIFATDGMTPVATIAQGHDITARKHMEEEQAKLEAQNRQLQKVESLSRMASAIAHTFNNQLGVVIGNLDMAIDEQSPGAESASHLLTAAMGAANKAAEVSGQMLTYLGQSFDKRELIDLAGVCQKNLPILEASVPGTVALEIDLSSPGPVVMGNAIEIQQALTNLITNAWEAVGTGRGSIHLSVKTVYAADIPASYRFPVGWQPQESAYACLEVADTGGGIADKDIEKLFDPFFTSKFTGRGMGLAAVIGIVRAHGGSITVESVIGRGSTFRVFLPLNVEEISRQPAKAATPLAIEKGGTVLLVEDEDMVRNMAAAMLKRLGFTVLEAKDGVEAVEVFRKHQDEVICVLSDLTMPRMNGWETLTSLRKLAPDIPVILASGYDKGHVMAGDHPELPQVFLGKPYRLKGLSDAISQALADRK